MAGSPSLGVPLDETAAAWRESLHDTLLRSRWNTGGWKRVVGVYGALRREMERDR